MPNPFVGPRPLTKSNPIFGRTREITELRHRLISWRLVLRYAPSGAGNSVKISLIRPPSTRQIQMDNSQRRPPPYSKRNAAG